MAGRLAPGERLSSEWELAQHYQTSRPTVRRAVAVLRAEGLVITQQGRGAFVRQLRLSPGVPVVRVLRTIYDAQGTPLEVQDSVAAADRHEFRYEVDMR